MRSRLVLSKTISVLVALALVVPNGFAKKASAAEANKSVTTNNSKDLATEALKKKIASNNSDKLKGKSQEDYVRVVVELTGESALDMAQKKGLKAAAKSDVQTVKDSQKNIQNSVNKLTGKSIRNTYGTVLNGFSTEVKVKDIDTIKKMVGVKDVRVVNVYHKDMNTAKELTEATKVWQDLGIKGEGTVVSIIDTGIDYTHKDMKVTDPSKDKLTKDNIKAGLGKFYTDKVPYGYNFADRNDEIKDTTSSMHGMHVSGIVAANGSDEDIKANNGVKGVAPEAQLLAMKVFSNNPDLSESATSDDIVAAIDESVNQGADIINMSLGSTASFQDDDDPEQKAIKRAVDAGTVVVVSAGNSQYATAPYKVPWMNDTGLVGAPGLAKDALQVASYENTSVTLSAITLEDGANSKAGYTTSEVAPTKVLDPNQDFDIVDCGIGQESDFDGKDVKGKVALIKRGTLDFVTKKSNAQAKGAAAVIVYNHESGGDTYINMKTDNSITIPGVFVTLSDGKKLLDLAKNGGKVKFGKDRITAPNVNTGDMSDFTSWGPTPNLDFKPQITAPGGNIFSTVNNNDYEVMSGTSMASPHVAGSEALIVEAIKKANPDLKGRDLVDLAKNTAVNTATIEMDKNHTTTPYSPRRQGAGMIQTEKAINNKVTVTNNGNSFVALKQIGNETSFDLTLNNYGDKAATYDLDNFGGVLTEQGGVTTSMSYDVKIDGATLTFDKSSVTVPAKGSATVKAKLTIPKGVSTDKFAEGFIKFNAKDIPSLVIPFMGFYGDWGAEQIIENMAYDEAQFLSPSYPTTEILGKADYLGVQGYDADKNPIINKDLIAISPNDDTLGDSFVPYLYFLRNAKNVDVELEDSNGKDLGKVANSKDIARNVYNDTNSDGSSPRPYSALAWNGKLNNSATGKEEVVPEGQYYLNIKAVVDFPGAKEQDYKVPVKVDLTAPDIKLVSANPNGAATKGIVSYHITLKVDENVGLLPMDPTFILNNEEVTPKNLQVKDGQYDFDVDLKENSTNDLAMAVVDSAYNIGSKDFAINVGKVDPIVFNDKFTAGFDTTETNYIVTGRVNTKLKVFKIAGKDVNIWDNGQFAIGLDLNQGVNVIPLYAEDENGNVIMNYSTKINCDSIAPLIKLESPAISGDGFIVTNKDSVTLKGTVEDNCWGYKFTINGEPILNVNVDGATGPEVNKKEFTKDIAVKDGDIIALKATDIFGNSTLINIKVKIDKTAPKINISGVTDGGLYNKDVKIQVTSDKEANLTTQLDGKDYNGALVESEGKHVLTVKAVDAAGNISEAKVSFEIDKTAPSLSIKGIEDGKLYNADVTPILQTEDGATVKALLDGKDYGFKAITTEGKHVLEVSSTDKAGNKASVKVVFDIDKTAPVFTVKDVETGSTYYNKVTPNITVDDKNAKVTLLLDGKAYDGKTSIEAEGNHVINGTAVDKAGNKSTLEIKFIVEKDVKIDKGSDGSIKADVRKPLDKDGKNVFTVDASNSASFTFENAGAISGGKGTLTLNVGGNTINLPLSAIDSRLLNANSKLIINTKVETNSPLTKGLKGVNKVFTFEMFVDNNGKKVQLHNFVKEGEAEVTLALSDSDLKGLDKGKLAIFYYNEEKKAFEVMETKVAGNKVTFKTPHFSKYILAEKQSSPSNGGSGNTGSNTNNGSSSGSTTTSPATMPQTGSVIDSNILIVFGILALAGGVLIIRRKRVN